MNATKILIVEDDEMNRDMLSRRLELENFCVIQASDGLEGIAQARAAAPDLILMDVGLPEMDGCQVTRRLKADEATRHIPIIALTGHAIMGESSEFLEAGCDDYECKPINWPRLMNAMQALLRRSSN